MFIAAAAVVLFVINNREPKGKGPLAPPPPPSSNPVRLVVVGIAPWLLIFAFVWFFVFRQLRGRNLSMSDSFVEKSQGMVADQRGVIWTEPTTRTEYRWEAFHAFDETPDLFLLYTTDPRKAQLLRFHMVPKRAFPEPTSLDEFRRLLADHVHPHDGAFPVLPPKLAETIVPGDRRMG